MTERYSGTPEQVERIARWMGWEVETMPTGWKVARIDGGNGGSVRLTGTGFLPLWDPFTDANADVQVLERVREVWRDGTEEGDAYARAVCAVLSIRQDVDYVTGGTVSLVLREFRVGTFAHAVLSALDATGEASHG